MIQTNRHDGMPEEKMLRLLCIVLLSAGLMSCMGASYERTSTASFSWDSALSPPLQISDRFNQMRDRIDQALLASKDSASDIARRARSRAIVSNDACFSNGQVDGCDMAAKTACAKAEYVDGSALSTSTYVACSGAWTLRAADAPEGVCKTKRRLQAALCW